MLQLLLLAGLAHYSLGGELSPVLAPHTIEAHGPLARQALHSVAYQGSVDPKETYPRAVLGLLASKVHPSLQHPGVIVQGIGARQFDTAITPFVQLLPADIDLVRALGHQAHSGRGESLILHSNLPGPAENEINRSRSKFTTAKLQVRRPAVKKNFYDIEERTVIRPVGSAIVEFQAPGSVQNVSPYTAPQFTSQYHPQYPPRVVYPINYSPFFAYRPLQVPVQSYPPSFIQQPQFPQQPIAIPQPKPPQVPPFPQQTPVQLPPQLPSTPRPTEPQTESVESFEFDPSDTVVIDNPDFSRITQQRTTVSNNSSAGETGNTFSERQNDEQAIIEINNESSEEFQQLKDHQVLNEFQMRQDLRKGILGNIGETMQPQSQRPNDYIQHTNFVERSKINVGNVQSDSTSLEEQLPSTDDTSAKSSLNVQQEVDRVRPFSSQEIPYFINLSPELEQDNKQKLIEFLTARGEVEELGLSRSRSDVNHFPLGNLGVRVVSVTPAPRSAPKAERVSTRRVVVSSPVHTVHEVEVSSATELPVTPAHLLYH